MFEKSFDDFKRGGKQCPKCGHKNGAKKLENRVTFNCEYCGKEKSVSKSSFNKTKHHFCNKECYDKWQNQKITFNCEYCGKEKSVKKSKLGKEHNFCSIECYNKWKESQTVVFNCEYCGKEDKMIKHRFENHEHHFCSMECRSKWQVGENNANYNPNITNEEREKGRHIEGYDDFIIDVYERDNYTCQCCGQYSGKIHAHHINGYNFDKEHRVDPDNGITLCEDCHKEFHKIYGYGDNTIAQFREFLFNKYTQSHDLKFLALIETIDLTTRAF